MLLAIPVKLPALGPRISPTGMLRHRPPSRPLPVPRNVRMLCFPLWCLILGCWLTAPIFATS
eukprot:10534815-Alexandrium_andersonii.AAC.1